jgi:hypothetical protein
MQIKLDSSHRGDHLHGLDLRLPEAARGRSLAVPCGISHEEISSGRNVFRLGDKFKAKVAHPLILRAIAAAKKKNDSNRCRQDR